MSREPEDEWDRWKREIVEEAKREERGRQSLIFWVILGLSLSAFIWYLMA